jgi:hypothetical protein
LASLRGLRVASANAKDVHIPSNSLRSISYASEGITLTTREQGWDLDDKEEATASPKKKRMKTSKKRQWERAQENGCPISLSGFPA